LIKKFWIRMCTDVERKAIDLKITRFFESSARILLSLLILVIMQPILAGIGCTFYDLRLVLNGDYHAAFKSILVDMLTVHAVVEVLRTALSYFTEGRVKVTYIIDTVIVTVLTEVMAFWYRDMDWQGICHGHCSGPVAGLYQNNRGTVLSAETSKRILTGYGDSENRLPNILLHF